LREGWRLNVEIKESLGKILSANLQLTPEALAFLESLDDKEHVIDKILKRIESMSGKPLVITKEFIEGVLEASNSNNAVAENSIKEKIEITGTKSFVPLSAEIPSDIKVISEPTKEIKSKGNVEDFISYFIDRFNRLKRLFMDRNDLKNVVTTKTVFKANRNEEVTLIGLVSSKNKTKTGNILLEIEDLEGHAKVIIPSRNPELIKKAAKIILDQAICIEGTVNNGLIIARNFFWPDISTQHNPKRTEEPIRAALISDIHVGSKEFMEDSFLKFIKWLRCEVGTKKQREIAGQVKYLIIAGDLVDGIGVYPNQEEDLLIKDVYEQYEQLSKYLELVPEYIQIIAIPGNHDATRQAIPQPAIPEKYAHPLYEFSNILLLGNPAEISLHGVNFLVSHGRSLDDLIADIPGMSIKKPHEAMKLLLVSRHLAPQFGKTPIAPERKDLLIIERVPDVFHAGHVHVNGQARYRNVTIINSGTWQDQTSFQRSIGLTPTPCRVPIYNFKTGEILLLNFSGN